MARCRSSSWAHRSFSPHNRHLELIGHYSMLWIRRLAGHAGTAVSMTYPKPSQDQIHFFGDHGYLVVENAIDQADLDELERHCERILAEKKRLALNEKT